MSATKSVTPRGPAADPKYLPSNDDSNPYGFTLQLLKAGQLPPKVTDKYVFFFGYEGSDPHVCFQQWFPSPFTAPRNPYKDDTTKVEFPTAEHYMMYHKALLMGDDEIAAKILKDAHPSSSKRFGREVRNFDLDVWKENADRVVEEANLAKFGQNADLMEVLLGTGDRVIVEARRLQCSPTFAGPCRSGRGKRCKLLTSKNSPDDKIWGIGFNSEDAEGRESEWGNNGLGKALMNVRDKLRKQE